MADGMSKYYNHALRQFKWQTIADVWNLFSSSFPNEDIVSLGSGTGSFELGLKALQPERRWTLIDRDPMSFNADGLRNLSLVRTTKLQMPT